MDKSFWTKLFVTSVQVDYYTLAANHMKRSTMCLILPTLQKKKKKKSYKEHYRIIEYVKWIIF